MRRTKSCLAYCGVFSLSTRDTKNTWLVTSHLQWPRTNGNEAGAPGHIFESQTWRSNWKESTDPARKKRHPYVPPLASLLLGTFPTLLLLFIFEEGSLSMKIIWIRTKSKWNYSIISRIHHLMTFWYHGWRITIAIVEFWRVYHGFIALIWELPTLKSLELKFGLSSKVSECLNKIPVRRILLDALFSVFDRFFQFY